MSANNQEAEKRAWIKGEATHAYEVVDATDEETYYTLGLFATADEAMSVLDCSDAPCNEDDEQSVIVEVRARKLGFHPHEFLTIARRVWQRNYDDTKPVWTAHPIEQCAPIPASTLAEDPAQQVLPFEEICLNCKHWLPGSDDWRLPSSGACRKREMTTSGAETCAEFCKK